MIYFKSGYFIIPFYVKHNLYIILKIIFNILIILYKTNLKHNFSISEVAPTLNKYSLVQLVNYAKNL